MVVLISWVLGGAPAAHAQDEDAEPPPAEATAETDEAQSDEAAVQDAEAEYRQEELDAAQEGARGFFQRSADNITSQLKIDWGDFRGLLEFDPVSVLGERWRDFNENQRAYTRLDLGLAYTVLWQGASSSPNGPSTAAAGDFDFFGTWHALGEEGHSAGRLGFNVQVRHTFGGIPPSELNQSIGSLLQTTAGFDDSGSDLSQFWWQQELAGGQVLLRFGKISMRDFFSTGRFQSSLFFFLNEALSRSLAVPFPGTGPGAVVFGFPTDWVYLAGGVGDARSNLEDPEFFDLFRTEALFSSLEAGFLTNFDGLGRGTYRLTLSYTDEDAAALRPEGTSFSLSFDQELGRFVPFLRYAVNGAEGLTSVGQVFTTGFGVFNPLGNDGDVFGFGFGWETPDNQALRDEYVLEAFYRVQVTPTFQFTPDLQVIINPSFSDEDAVGVLSFRFRIQY